MVELPENERETQLALMSRDGHVAHVGTGKILDNSQDLSRLFRIVKPREPHALFEKQKDQHGIADTLTVVQGLRVVSKPGIDVAHVAEYEIRKFLRERERIVRRVEIFKTGSLGKFLLASWGTVELLQEPIERHARICHRPHGGITCQFRRRGRMRPMRTWGRG